MANSHFQKLLEQLRAEHEKEIAKLRTANRKLSVLLQDGEQLNSKLQSVTLTVASAKNQPEDVWLSTDNVHAIPTKALSELVIPGLVDVDAIEPIKPLEASLSPLRRPSLEPAPLPMVDSTEPESVFYSSTMSRTSQQTKESSALMSRDSKEMRSGFKARRAVSFDTDVLLDKEFVTPVTPLPLTDRVHGDLECQMSGKATQGVFLRKGNMLVSTLNVRDPEFLKRFTFMAWHNHAKLVRNPIRFKILPELVALPTTYKSMLMQATPTVATDASTNDVEPDDDVATFRADGCVGRFMISPGSRSRISWDVMATLLLAYDMFMIPLSAFGQEQGGFIAVMEWFCLVFWTVDMLMSCITGVFVGGIVVLEPFVIFVTYLRTWFVLDVFVNVPDWIFTIIKATSDGDKTSAASSGRLLRAARIFRIARLLRVAKLQKMLIMLRDCIETELTFLIISILKLVFMVLTLNHFIAALWWSIGYLAKDSGDANWIDSTKIYDDSLVYRYLTSLHWSICMFTPGSMNVQPHNAGERSFAILVLVSGMVVFTAFISSMTTAIAQLRKMQSSDSKDIWMLRRFLRQHNIGQELSFRVLRYVDSVMKQQNSRKVAADKVWAISILSDQLRTEVQFEAMFSCLNTHPLFEHMCALSKVTMVRLVGTALSTAALGLGDVLFSGGAEGTHMHIVSGGKLIYRRTNHDDVDDKGQRAETDDWFCEPVLWTKWAYLGVAHATHECELVGIHSANFIQVLKSDAHLMEDVYNYAWHFVENLSTIPYGSLSDLSKAYKASKTVLEFLNTACESSFYGRAGRSAIASWGSSKPSNVLMAMGGRRSVISSGRRRSSISGLFSEPLTTMVKRMIDESTPADSR